MQDNRYNHPAILALNPYSSVKEVESAYRKSRLFIYTHQYAKDKEFEICFKSINTLKKAREFIKQLNQDRLDHDKGAGMNYPCQKTYGILPYLKDSFWQKKEHLATVFADNRRIHCCCHEAGSYKKKVRSIWYNSY